jgi:hypothetical protein
MSDLINTVENPGEFDALTTLRPGEPYFLLVGRDRLAPDLVLKWADKNRARALDEFGAGLIDEEKRDRELRKSTQAEAIGWSMTAYKAGHMAQQAAEQTDNRPTYSGHELPAETARRDRLQSARARAASAINNAAAEVNDLVELLKAEFENDRPPELEKLSDAVVGSLKAISDAITPRRVGVREGV